MKRLLIIAVLLGGCASLRSGENLDVEINVTLNDLYDWYQKCRELPRSEFDDLSLDFFHKLMGPPIKIKGKK